MDSQCDNKPDSQLNRGSNSSEYIVSIESGTETAVFLLVTVLFLSASLLIFLSVLHGSSERKEVHAFLLANMQNGGILELMIRYLKAVGQTFLEEWPAGLSVVVLDLFNCWRKHSAGLPNPLLRDSSNQHIKVRLFVRFMPVQLWKISMVLFEADFHVQFSFHVWNDIKGIVHPKNLNLLLIYSPSNHHLVGDFFKNLLFCCCWNRESLVIHKIQLNGHFESQKKVYFIVF